MITLHHLETSRSSRIIWLLEALGLDYDLVTHKREPDMRAPDALSASPSRRWSITGLSRGFALAIAVR